MLQRVRSTPAENAGEPPAHVIFILATTEVHKLPATIFPRCQRFDFKRIQPETMAIRLKQVAGFENLD
jgi:DNA polymerase-3 subunit gamma/tau